MKNIIYLLIILTSCSVNNKPTEDSVVPIVEKVDSTNDVEVFKMSDPIFMAGSTFGHYFQAYYKIGNFDMLMKMTSKESIDKFGYNEILESYENMEFGYSIKFKSMIDKGDNRWLMNYETEQNATKKILRIVVKLENDTVKLVVKDLEHIF